MRTIFSAIVFLAILVMVTPATATAQEPLLAMPTVILLPESAPDGLKITAVVFGPCVGRITIEVGITGVEPLEVPPLKRFESVVFYTGKVLPQGENTFKADIRIVDQGDCAFPPVINPVKFLVGTTGNFGVNDPQLASGISIDRGFPWLNFQAKLPQGTTYGMLFQLFPNGTNSKQQFLAPPTSDNLSTLRVNGAQMDIRLPFFLWMIAEGSQMATVTMVNP